VSKPLAMALLACHLGALAYFCVQWIHTHQRQQPKDNTTRLSPHYICYTMFVSNFCGIAFARTLHYQFFAWYISSCAFLLWSPSPTSLSPLDPMPIRILLLVGLEFAFLTFPATPTSSMVLQLVHLAILANIRPPKVMWEEVKWVDDNRDALDKKNS